MRGMFAVAVFAVTCGSGVAQAQRLDHTRIAARASRPERSESRKNWIVVQRTLWSTGVSTLALIPAAFVLGGAEAGSPTDQASAAIAAATLAAYFAGVVGPAVTMAGERCSGGRRVARSFGGAIVGGLTGAAIAGMMHNIGHKNAPAVVGASSAILGAPFGSALALRGCD